MSNLLDLNLIRLGHTLPDWNLESIFDNDPVPNTNEYIGKPLLILFFSFGCPGCLGRAIPYANRVKYEMGDQINVLGIHTNFEGVDFSTEQFIKNKSEFHLRFPIYKDYNYNTTYTNYRAGGTPHWILTDDNGIVVYSIFGSDPNNALLRLDLKMKELFNK